MQTSDVISINIWQMIVSLANLVILFRIVKKFLYKPVKKMLNARQDAIASQYNEAENAKNEALSQKQAYEKKLSDSKTEADGIIRSAVNLAKTKENEILEKAKSDAKNIIREAKEAAELEFAKAEEHIRYEIIDVSSLLTSRILEREINSDDHKRIIDAFIEGIGDSYDTN